MNFITIKHIHTHFLKFIVKKVMALNFLIMTLFTILHLAHFWRKFNIHEGQRIIRRWPPGHIFTWERNNTNKHINQCLVSVIP